MRGAWSRGTAWRGLHVWQPVNACPLLSNLRATGITPFGQFGVRLTSKKCGNLDHHALLTPKLSLSSRSHAPPPRLSPPSRRPPAPLMAPASLV